MGHTVPNPMAVEQVVNDRSVTESEYEYVTSGLRLGASALTRTRKKNNMAAVGKFDDGSVSRKDFLKT